MLLKLLRSVAVVLLFSVCCFAGTCPKELGAAAKTQSVLDRIAHPNDWHFIIVCSDSDWQFLLRHFGEQHTTSLGATSLINRTTWLKSDIFSAPSGESGYVHVILHEVGHIRCQCKSDLTADKIASELFQKLNEVRLAQDHPASNRELVPKRKQDEADRKPPTLSDVAARAERKTCTASTSLSLVSACATYSLK